MLLTLGVYSPIELASYDTCSNNTYTEIDYFSIFPRQLKSPIITATNSVLGDKTNHVDEHIILVREQFLFQHNIIESSKSSTGTLHLDARLYEILFEARCTHPAYGYLFFYQNVCPRIVKFPPYRCSNIYDSTIMENSFKNNGPLY